MSIDREAYYNIGKICMLNTERRDALSSFEKANKLGKKIAARDIHWIIKEFQPGTFEDIFECFSLCGETSKAKRMTIDYLVREGNFEDLVSFGKAIGVDIPADKRSKCLQNAFMNALDCKNLDYAEEIFQLMD